jgi:pimeloyl-ACP methyl ester carboxylesterase
MAFLELPGYRLHYQTLGRPDAPPLLLIMGLGMGFDAWDTLPSRLADHFHVIVFDNRGMGWSTDSHVGFRIHDLADDAARVLDAAGVAQAFVFGISMGGMIAQELALRHPDRVRALVLGATFGSHWKSHKPGVGVARDLLLVTLSSRSPKRMARLLVSDGFMSEHQARFVAWLGRLSRPRRATARRQILAIARHEAEDRLSRLRIPTLVISGDRDRLVPVENSRRLARMIPRARLVELRGVGHAFPFEKTDETVRAVVEHCLASYPETAPRPFSLSK